MFRRKNRSEGEPRPNAASLHVAVDHNICYFCGACVAVCPPDSIFLENARLHIDDSTCTRCERCVKMCPVHALRMATDKETAHA